MAKEILGKKLGMTQIFEADGKMIPVTVVEAGPCIVLQNKTEETDGYNAIQVGFGELKEKQLTNPMKGHFAKAGVTPVKFIREFRLAAPSEYKVGDKIAADIFTAGELVDAVGVSRGRGFAGTIKRHNFARGPMKHGSKSHREAGSMGPRYSGPGGRVIKGKKLPGRLGGISATVQRLTIAKVDVDRNLILVKGSVPGATGTFLVLRETVKPDVVKASKK
jgi:large subunit ribosomal protein L3